MALCYQNLANYIMCTDYASLGLRITKSFDVVRFCTRYNTDEMLQNIMIVHVLTIKGYALKSLELTKQDYDEIVLSVKRGNLGNAAI